MWNRGSRHPRNMHHLRCKPIWEASQRRFSHYREDHKVILRLHQPEGGHDLYQLDPMEIRRRHLCYQVLYQGLELLKQQSLCILYPNLEDFKW